MNRFLEPLCFVLLVAYGELTWGASPKLVRFPGADDTLQSPDGAYSILNVDRDESPNHSLFLHEKETGADRKILDYGRHVDVMWAPGSKAFFVNDYAGSSESNCDVFSIDELRRSDVLHALESAHETLPSNDHRYITCTGWHGNTVVVSVSGRSEQEGKGVELRFSLDTQTGQIHSLR